MISASTIKHIDMGLIGVLGAILLLFLAPAVQVTPPTTPPCITEPCIPPPMPEYCDAAPDVAFTQTLSVDDGTLTTESVVQNDATFNSLTLSPEVTLLTDTLDLYNRGACPTSVNIYTVSYNVPYVTVKVDGVVMQDHFTRYTLPVGGQRTVTITVSILPWTTEVEELDHIARIAFDFRSGFDKNGYPHYFSPYTFNEVYRLTDPPVPPPCEHPVVSDPSGEVSCPPPPPPNYCDDNGKHSGWFKHERDLPCIPHHEDNGQGKSEEPAPPDQTSPGNSEHGHHGHRH